jgi:thioredoxin reductase
MTDVAIVGAGPYGLSIAAHLRKRGIQFRIFGRPMNTWRSEMPKGMLLKSDGFASDLYDPERKFTLKNFCAERGIDYADAGLPVRLDAFVAYGMAFKESAVPQLEEKLVSGITGAPNGFFLRLDDGQTISARRVVIAVGTTHFAYVPPVFVQLPSHLASHSSQHHDLDSFKGRRIAVIGAGSSAIDLAGLLHEAGADVTLIARQKVLKFHARGTFPRPLWDRIRHPQSGLGPGLKSRFFSNWPTIFRYLPQNMRLHFVKTHLGPSGGWFAKEKLMGHVPLMLGCNPESAEAQGDSVRLRLRASDGTEHEFVADHVICATGYRVDLERLAFLGDDIRSKIRTVGTMPMLSSTFESSVPNLYFTGLAAANTFGPLMRFAFGAGFASSRIGEALARGYAKSQASAPIPAVPVEQAPPSAESTAGESVLREESRVPVQTE